MGDFREFANKVLEESVIDKISDTIFGNVSLVSIANELRTIKQILLKADGGESFLTNEQSGGSQHSRAQIEVFINTILARDVDPVRNPNWSTEFSAYLEQVKGYKITLMSQLIGALAMQSGYDEKYFSKFERDFSDAISKYEIEISNKVKKSEEILTSLEMNLEQRGTSSASAYFKDLHDAHKRKSFIYGFFTSLAVIVFAVAVWCGAIQNKSFTKPANVYQDIPIITLFALGWFVVRILARNLRFAQRQSALNKTKSVILLAGEQFALGTKDRNIAGQITWAVVSNVFSLNDLGTGAEQSDLMQNLQGFPGIVSKFSAGE